jgi:pSer/pThr/pTyr-binding forkhead associated (FHA) protein
MDGATIAVSALVGGCVSVVTAYVTTRIQSAAEQAKWRREFAQAYAELAGGENAHAQRLATQFPAGFVKYHSESTGDNERRFIAKGITMIIGRDEGCDICIDDAGLSRRHAALRSSESSVTITDLGTGSGVFVNGSRVGDRYKLRSGDVVRIGSTDLEFFTLH